MYGSRTCWTMKVKEPARHKLEKRNSKLSFISGLKKIIVDSLEFSEDSTKIYAVRKPIT